MSSGLCIIARATKTYHGCGVYDITVCAMTPCGCRREADAVLAALAAAGLVVIDPAADVTEIARQLLDFAYAIEEASVGDHGYMAVLEVRRVLRAAGEATP